MNPTSMDRTAMDMSISSTIVQRSIQEPQTFLAFAVGEREYAVEIAKVVHLHDLTEVPVARDGACARVTVNGEELPLFDLRQMLHVPRDKGSAKPLMLVLQAGTKAVATVVDALTDVFTAARRPLLPEAAAEYAGAAALVEGRQVPVLALESLQADVDQRLAA
jgi:chemotaxis signal transduction protein